ncbi:MAG: HEAT repeat domain-containing protein, partial [Acidobacteria bacterium]|nr:HEAT repeat domain-containing protein [Acidobacteriota bacterium]
MIAVVPVLLVLVTFLFWYQTWFGRRLSDADMGKYLADTSAPRKTQHALSQLAERVARGDAAARRWYPRVVALSGNKEPGLRVMAAWVMGQDNRSEEFHTALKPLLDDPDPMVRRNAALALVRFGDASGRAELRAMLQAYLLT